MGGEINLLAYHACDLKHWKKLSQKHTGECDRITGKTVAAASQEAEKI